MKTTTINQFLLLLASAIIFILIQNASTKESDHVEQSVKHISVKDLLQFNDDSKIDPRIITVNQRIKRQSDRNRYPYPVPIPILSGSGLGGAFGRRGFGGGGPPNRGFGSRSFGARSFGARGFGGRGIGGVGRGIGGFGGRGRG